MNIKLFLSLIFTTFAVNNIAFAAETDKCDIFYFTDGACISKHSLHLEFVSGTSYQTGEKFDVDTIHIGGIAPLKVSFRQSLEDFISSLERTGLYNKEDSDRKRLTANWKRFYSTKIDGIFIKHTPMYIQIGGGKNQQIHITKSLNSFSLTNPLILNIFQTQEEFTAALIHSGIHSPADEAVKVAASPWTKSFETVNFVTIMRTPIYIDIGGLICSNCTTSRINELNLRTPLVLNLSQTEEEFTAALRRSGLLFTEEDLAATDQAINAAFRSFGVNIKIPE